MSSQSDTRPHQAGFERAYLGDGVYARFDGHSVKLTTSDGRADTNQIYLDPQVVSNLLDFLHSVALAKRGDA